jgi:triacylglycerol lipase
VEYNPWEENAQMLLPQGFDKAIAEECARLTLAAYDQYNQGLKGQKWELGAPYDMWLWLAAVPEGVLAQKEVFGFVAYNRDTGNTFVVFRGTQSPGDWLSNLKVHQTPDPWGNVERGFDKIYQQCKAPILATLAKAGANPKIYVTGHSLGGALAVLATADLVRNGYNASMYSFAGPRAADPQFAKSFNAAVPHGYRVVNTEDIVTTVPLATPRVAPGKPVLDMAWLKLPDLDYQHVGTAVQFTENHESIVGNHDMKVYLAAVQRA